MLRVAKLSSRSIITAKNVVYRAIFTSGQQHSILRNQQSLTSPLVFRRNHGNHDEVLDDPVLQTKEMKRITYVGLWMNVLLTGTKAVVGFLMNSSSLLADAVHSLSDMISDFVTLGTVNYSRRPPNKKWIYGYGKLESVSSLFVAGILIGTSGAVFVHISYITLLLLCSLIKRL